MTGKKTRTPSRVLPRVEVGILGGTGLYEIEGIEDLKEYRLRTPLGDPSDAYIVGQLEGRRVAFLSRHGRGHRLLPMEINYRANVYGFKMLGAERIISVNSVGSLREEIRPRDFVFVDQFYDKTRRRGTFFGEGIVAHISFAEPVCPELSRFLHGMAVKLGIRSHLGGMQVCMDGPAFSTKAESRIHRLWGGDVVGMTSVTEAKLFREAEICYTTMNLATDYDCWRAEGEAVSVELVLENMRLNIHSAKSLIRSAIAAMPPHDAAACGCRTALAGAIVTDPKLIPAVKKRELRLIIEKYIK
jgi:5'-methylthioadenosine phosphorylase